MSTPWALRVDGLTKRYGTLLGCQDVSFRVAPGEEIGRAHV